ncbi:tetratricopeptide repeat protein [Algicella marina]|uniref:Tetratricopeptide repeat protein n=1 Tax=Algicella marina TaxID=2683284 RepID=A0A6P1SZI6_9RHOB|nr:tetratricopeptide repeat protein [Algicella marina]QHQ35157.1 tetratricopeptide repeat protein [Algicella marina]
MQGLEKLPDLLARHDWPAAERMLKRAAERKDAPAAVFYNLGKVMMEQGKWAPARKRLRQAVEVEPGHANAWFELGRATLEAGDLTEAADAFGRALMLVPEDGDARRNFGRVALRLGRVADAWEALLPLQGTDPEVDMLLYRAAAEGRQPEAESLRAELWDDPARRQHAIVASVRASKGRLPLRF